MFQPQFVHIGKLARFQKELIVHVGCLVSPKYYHDYLISQVLHYFPKGIL